MGDFQSVKSHFDSQNLSYDSFPKSEKPIKSVIRHLPHNTPAEDISDGLVTLGFAIVNVKQLTASRRSHPEESKIINLPLFLVTLQRKAKLQEIFRLYSPCQIACGAEAVTYTMSSPRKEIHLPRQHAATVGWRKEKIPSRTLSGF
jgi:hypothetical protein